MSNGLSEKVVKEVLNLMTDKADQANRSNGMGGVFANVIDDCRRLLAEAARANGMPNLDRFYGQQPAVEKAEQAPSIFDEWDGLTRTRPFESKENHESDGPPTTRPAQRFAVG